MVAQDRVCRHIPRGGGDFTTKERLGNGVGRRGEEEVEVQEKEKR